jgi:hypothetical protein
MDNDKPVYHLHDPDLPPEALEDHMKPPKESILVHCLHCGQEYESYEIVWEPNDKPPHEGETHRMPGMWCCPVEGCGGAGFCFDIFPVDEDYVDPETGERLWHDDPPMIEGHESDCECAECEMARDEQEAEWEREHAEYQRKIASGEIKPPAPHSPHTPGSADDDDIPF